MPQPRVYETDADRQAAYRQRVAQRRALAGSDLAEARIAELERAVAAETRRADQAEATVAVLRRRLAASQTRAERAETALRQARHPPPPGPAGQVMNRAQRRKAQRRQPRPR